jgi:hypothetical protein
VPVNKYEGYIVKNLRKVLPELDKTRLNYGLLTKISRFINKFHESVKYNEYCFITIADYIYDGFMLCFRKIEEFIKFIRGRPELLKGV